MAKNAKTKATEGLGNAKVNGLLPNVEQSDGTFLTTNHGVKINDDQNS